MGSWEFISILILVLTIQTVWSQSNPSDHPEAQNIDLPEYLQDWGYPTKNCKDIWTLCGSWAYDRNYNPPVCCRSKGPNKGIVCRTPNKRLKEFAAGFSDSHKSFCLPIIFGSAWNRNSMIDNDDDILPEYHPSSPASSPALLKQEIVEQLSRIADALETKAKKP